MGGSLVLGSHLAIASARCAPASSTMADGQSISR